MDQFIVSARKYRPATFHSVVGQRTLTETLKNATLNNKLAHAYLFCGPRGVGKTTCARIFAKTINCLNLAADGEACNECESCRSFNEERSLNIHELDAASNNSVDNIRDLIDQIRFIPQIGKYKVYIIDEVHMLSTAAFNAFLKTLEEPPPYAKFILATTEKHKILPTILSRCQIYDFGRITIQDTVEHLKYVAQSEGISVEEQALCMIAQKADGGMRDALSIFDQVANFSGGNVTYEKTITNLNILDYQYYFRLVQSCINGNTTDALLLFNEVLNQGFDGQNFITGFGSHLRNLFVCKDIRTAALLEVSEGVAQEFHQQAVSCPNRFLFESLSLCNDCDFNYRLSRNKRLLVELTLIKICKLIGGNNETQTTNTPTQQQTVQSPHQPINVLPTPTTQKNRQQPTPAPIIVAEPPATYSPPSHPQTEQPASPTPNPIVQNGETHRPTLISSKKKVTTDETSIERTEEIIDSRSSFNDDQLREAWLTYTNKIPTKQVLKNTMFSCLPKIQADGTTFEVAVYNSTQVNELQRESIELIRFLRSELHNGAIRMTVREAELEEIKALITPQDQLNEMVLNNTSLSDFMSKLQLKFR